MPRQLHREDATTEVCETELVEIPEPDAGTFYTLRELTTAKWREIKKLNTTKRPNKQTRQMEDVLDEEAFSDDLVDYVIVGWRGIVDNGADAPCTRENKLRLDGTIKSALVGRAGLTQIVQAPDARAASFRATADVG
jgi:hypothetical protein